MTFRKSILLLISLSMIAALVACSSSSTTTTPPPPAITVTLTSPATFPTVLYVNDTLSVTATVANDSANGGVIWSCSPGNSAATCGSFSSGTTAVASGTAAIYTAPSAPVAAVTLIATSVTTSTISASSASIAINATVISVALTTPSSLAAGATATIAATVTGDPATLGVNWSCTPAATCGSFNPTGTASAATTVYTAPTTAGSVVITATSVSDDTQSASATVTITPLVVVAPLPDGTYVFSLAGFDSVDVSSYYVAGAFTVLGGAITTGEQDFVDFGGDLSDPISATGSSIAAADAAGNLQIVLNTNDTNLGVGGVETLNVSVLPNNPARAFIIEFDASATASGELNLQNATAAAATPLNGYAFGLNGYDQFEEDGFLSMGGVINVDSAGGISGTGSIFDANDSASPTLFQAQTFSASTVSAPDSLGRVVFTLNPTDSTDFPQIVLAGYIVDASRIRLVEADGDAYTGTLGGTAFSQGANTGTFSTASLSGGSYVLGMSGWDTSPDGILQTAGLLTANAGGTVAGFVDFNDLTGSEPVIPDPVSAPAYTVDPTGRVTIANVTDGTNTFNLQLYLDGNGNATAITLDLADGIEGNAYLQSGGGAFTAGSFSGAYGLNVTGWDENIFGELDAVGPVTADGVGTFAGAVDLNWLFSAGPTYPDLPVSGTFTAAANGVFSPGTITGLDVTTTTNADAFDYYLIDATGDNITIETDLNQLTLGYFAQQ